MQPRRCILSAFALGTTIVFGSSALAADPPKEGTFSGTFSGVGTYKANLVGKERLLLVFDENEIQVTNGLLDHASAHCWGLGDYSNGTGSDHGYCILTDPDGDQVVASIADEKHPLGQKRVDGSGTITLGTGKYAGISGGWTNALNRGWFGTLTPNMLNVASASLGCGKSLH